jgi:CubicO group peptidase (beta-lactamase class C family)
MSEGEGFAEGVRASVAAGEISGAVAAVMTRQLLRVEAYGFRDKSSRSPTETDTIFRIGSMAKASHTAAALALLDDKKFHLDDDIAKWAPELANRQVLRTLGSEVDDTVPAKREITMFDVLTFQLGYGMYLGSHDYPHFKAMATVGVAPQPEPVAFGPDDFLARLGTLPLAHQPGEAFMYHTGDDVLRVLISRIAGQSLGEVLHERVFEPCGMVDSGLSVPAAKRHRLSTCYWGQANPAEPLQVWDPPEGRFAADPIFPNSLVSTAGDYLKLAKMLLNEGEFQGRRVLSTKSVSLMMTDHLTDPHRNASPAPEGFWQTRGWGMGGTVYARSLPQGPNAGAYSWYGGYGGHFLFDKKLGSAIVLLVPRMNMGPQDTALGYEFELATYRSVLSTERVREAGR